jgi:hypothetical protein
VKLKDAVAWRNRGMASAREMKGQNYLYTGGPRGQARQFTNLFGSKRIELREKGEGDRKSFKG